MVDGTSLAANGKTLLRMSQLLLGLLQSLAQTGHLLVPVLEPFVEISLHLLQPLVEFVAFLILQHDLVVQGVTFLELTATHMAP
jgi:hypothetical protein